MTKMLKTIQLPVHSIAHGRAGDKGDISNVSLIAYNKFGWENIKINATEDIVLLISFLLSLLILGFFSLKIISPLKNAEENSYAKLWILPLLFFLILSILYQ